MKIRWQDRISNVEVLRRSGMPPVEAILAKMQLRWTGHVIRMEDHRIPKSLLYGELATGHRRVGRPCLRYKDVVKRHVKTVGLDASWEMQAQDRDAWRRTVVRGGRIVEEKWEEKQMERRARRRRREPSSDTTG